MPVREGQSRKRSWLLLGLLSAGAAFGFVVSGTDSDQVSAADAAPSYELFNLKIQYPYVNPRDIYTDEVEARTNEAGVSYASRWAGSTYPGTANCEIVLYDGDGDIVGRAEFGLSSGSPQYPPTDFWPQVEVTAPPVSATGSCANSVYPTGNGYAFERPVITRPTDQETGRTDRARTQLAFRARWTTTTDPALRTCSATVHFENGSSKTYGPLNVYLPPGESLILRPPIADPASIRDAEVKCSELKP